MTRLLPLLLALACTAEDADKEPGAADGDGVVDLRMDFPEPPAQGFQLRTPEMVIPAYSEKQWCFFSTYDGPDIAINRVDTFQPQFGHHAQLLETFNDPDDWPDGTEFDCTERDTLPMTDMEPVYIAEPVGEGLTSMDLGATMGVELESGTRLIIQSHYVNTSPDPVRVQDAINIGYLQTDEVQTWAAPFAHVLTDMPLPANQETSLHAACEWDAEYNIMYMGGHLHEWGLRYAVDWIPTEGDTERVYEVAEWDQEYRDSPPMNSWAPGEFTVNAGDVFDTTCTWFNDQDRELNFPEEMCATFGMYYPSKVGMICDPS